ncbi:MAG: hypothetical protein GF308_21910 [Candidatus Heimdallarchaeota archaeon]|nr:hypothetical protein [Candidatus Heimdallarchaeota archaeon]
MSEKLTEEEEKKIERLIGELKEEEGWIRFNAAWELGGMGMKGKGAIEPLRKALKEEKNKATKFWIAYSLARLEGTKEGVGIRVLQEMNKERELEEWQEGWVERLYQELAVKEEERMPRKSFERENRRVRMLFSVRENWSAEDLEFFIRAVRRVHNAFLSLKLFSELVQDLTYLKIKGEEIFNPLEIFNQLDSYSTKGQQLYIHKINMSSPGEISFIGLHQIINSIIDFLKELIFIRYKRGKMQIELLKQYYELREKNPEVFPPVSSAKEVLHILNKDLKKLQKLKEKGKLTKIYRD